MRVISPHCVEVWGRAGMMQVFFQRVPRYASYTHHKPQMCWDEDDDEEEYDDEVGGKNLYVPRCGWMPATCWEPAAVALELFS